MKKFGFGCMRLPMKDGEVNYEEFSRMVDRFLKEGFRYFDTAHGYLDGKSETAVRDCLVKRYPRSAYSLTDKLTDDYFKKEEDIRPLFEEQLEKTGVDYFDYYLIHSVTASNYPKFQRCEAFKVASELRREGKIHHLGMSFHDNAQLLEQILTEHPEIEIVQIQLNYKDYDDPSIQSRAVYDVCEKFHKPVIVMEPCKGGGLINLPDEASKIFNALGGSYASYAIRFCASFPSVVMVLSGMSNCEQLEQNVAFMKDFKPFSEEEYKAVEQVRAILKKLDAIACTACRYCVPGCPKQIPIPDIFACFNAKKKYKNDWNSDFYYSINTAGKGKASDCIRCGKCERTCPQHLPVRDLLRDAAAVLEHTNQKD